jgi:hypothetical protein
MFGEVAGAFVSALPPVLSAVFDGGEMVVLEEAPLKALQPNTQAMNRIKTSATVR